ncbi:MAG: hypothetical protein R6X19_01145 [Kiritimatiellia bacterium]
MSVFEILMLICFGAAWPFALIKSWTSRQTGGKSIMFLVVVFLGYLSGVIHKLLHSPDGVIYLYALNGTLVFADILVYFRNRRLERRAGFG